jgi:hypothetical protein
MPKHPAHALLSRLIGALLVIMPAAAQAKSTDGGTVNLQNIIAKCSSSVTLCMSAFDLYSRVDSETNLNGRLSILTFFKASDQTFSGYAEELYYTEVKMNGIQYQVGYGYIVAAHQQDAKPSGSGAISLIPIGGAADAGSTAFTTSVIGLAADAPRPAASTCESPGLTGDQLLVCAVDIQPTVTQDYFKAQLSQLSGAFSKYMQSPPANTGSMSAICPQVINYRTEDRKLSGRQVTLSAAQLTDLMSIQTQLSAICENHRPNVHLSYKNGRQNGPNAIELDIGGAVENAAQSLLSQGYYRNRYYLADTALRRYEYYAADDQFAEIYINGLTGAASLPSLLAAIVTLNTAVQDLRIHAYEQCSGGAKAISLKPFSATTVDPVTSAAAYGAFVDGVRKAADADQNSC